MRYKNHDPKTVAYSKPLIPNNEPTKINTNINNDVTRFHLKNMALFPEAVTILALMFIIQSARAPIQNIWKYGTYSAHLSVNSSVNNEFAITIKNIIIWKLT